MPNPTSSVTLPIVLNMLNTAQLRVITGQPAARMWATISYLGIEDSSATVFLSVLLGIVIWFYWTVLPSFSYSLAFAAFAAFPVAERLGGARDVQLMTGMRSSFFIFVNLVFDWLCYMVIIIPWWLIHYYFSDYSVTTAGFASVIGYTVVEGLIGWNVVPAFMLFPPFAIIACLVKISQMENKATKCALVSAAAGARSVRMMEPPTSGVGAAYAPGYMATEQARLQLVSDSCDVTTPFSFSGDGILLNLLFLMGEGLVFFAILSAILSGYSTGSRETVPLDKQGKVDEDVEEERRLVNRLRDNKDFGGHALVAWNLHKLFGPLHAVRGVHLSLRPAECFGLLGVNGAGKTTTFQMLAGLTTASHGDAYTEHATLSQNLRKWQSQISYCFQLGGLLDRLNAYEYLYLIGRLRGITEKDLKPAVDSVISVVDLKPHADKECGVYSGGNRRKLSIGAALLGLPPIVFLDEPYAGVDVVSRTKIFKAISLIKQKSRIAVMLTSHKCVSARGYLGPVSVS
ncbi:hypothetical protein HPB48_003142 [Haemaphysalis longicornis]|uniref:ABC transporter domain-containing protein n=1 Tax=Haemaphysalis longicornis TaxID=44386 RepID=A0A9J6GPD8_HAELO|nr:hypothetical protein HPB48_003142 [Haemaphysalis longicornis]